MDHGRPSEENPTRRILRFNQEAQKLWYEAISDIASKQADNMARLAALFQIVMDGPGAVEEIGVEVTQGAIAVAE